MPLSIDIGPYSFQWQTKCLYIVLFQLNFMLFIIIYRVMAAALSLTFGRGGALIGNLIFGFLIDLNCVIPIVLFSTMLFSKLFSPFLDLFYLLFLFFEHTHKILLFILFVFFFYLKHHIYSQLVVFYVCCCQIPAAKHWIDWIGLKNHCYRIVSTLKNQHFFVKINSCKNHATKHLFHV